MGFLDTIRNIFHSIHREAWKRFFIAMAGLVLAFGTALYSTVFSRDGNEFGARVAASLALLIAGFVGLYTVPYLAKRVSLERVTEAFDYDVTREGIVYLTVALVIGIAALNTGNNLLYIIIAAMLAAVLVSGAASWTVLRGLRLEVSLPAHIFAGQSVMSRLHLRSFFPVASFSVSVVPPKGKTKSEYKWQRGKLEWPKKWPKHKQLIRLPDLQYKKVEAPPAPDNIFRGEVYFPYIPAGSESHADVELAFQKRGAYAQDEFGLSSKFPFSFLKKTRRLPMERAITVYPSVEQTDDFFHVLPMITGEFEAYVRGRGHDLYRIREHQPGDSSRLVDWKATAKASALMVREFTREDEQKLRIIFDNPAPGEVAEADYEASVALAASLAWHFAGTNTELSFAAADKVDFTDVYSFLHYLALVQPQEGVSILEDLPETADYNLVLTAKGRGSLPTELWANSYVIFMDKRKGVTEEHVHSGSPLVIKNNTEFAASK